MLRYIQKHGSQAQQIQYSVTTGIQKSCEQLFEDTSVWLTGSANTIRRYISLLPSSPRLALCCAMFSLPLENFLPSSSVLRARGTPKKAAQVVRRQCITAHVTALGPGGSLLGSSLRRGRMLTIARQSSMAHVTALRSRGCRRGAGLRWSPAAAGAPAMQDQLGGRAGYRERKDFSF